MTIGGKKISLTTQIFVAMIIGSIAGLICGDIMKQVAFKCYEPGIKLTS